MGVAQSRTVRLFKFSVVVKHHKTDGFMPVSTERYELTLNATGIGYWRSPPQS